ncbi:prenyltransferase/squalene oxidase repeat-containing protein [Desulfuromonas sp. TF]|uniref:prenyltransferase/squalene oxidase repeat-containing protein n=1 Tax=Desulfuromonas sp. TF TaxID=1232410 RepID=UPI0003FDDE63|nr:prenyltransferase/squalene oxidase repeat-containing protein [Desulfuromonas sp. TF]
MDPAILKILTELNQRSLSGGGFEEFPGKGYRPDSTAWAVMAFSAVDLNHASIAPALRSLTRSQSGDGGVALLPEYPQACWPTPLAILAWMNFQECAEPLQRAISFLLHFTGVHGDNPVGSPLAHNTALKGWPWIADTHSWVEPTALSVIALRSAGHRGHSRIAEAVEMLMDRQLHDGGWNYGNTEVYGQQLSPMPDSTGLALCALSGLITEKEVIGSIAYLNETVPEIRTPFSLSWGLLGLNAWNRPHETAGEFIDRCMNRRFLYGGFSTTHLCLLLLAHPDMAQSSIFQMQGSKT